MASRPNGRPCVYECMLCLDTRKLLCKAAAAFHAPL